MENLMLKSQKKEFSIFDSALACVLFILLNIIFLQSYYLIPASTIYGNIVIPEETISNNVTYTVTSIDDEAFYACSSIENITIPNTITEIGASAFAGCGITTIFIPSSVTTIKTSSYIDSPFYACSSKLVIYLEASSVPEGFGEYWNYRTDGQPLEVKYGYSREEYLAENELTEEMLSSTDDSQISFNLNSSTLSASISKGKEGFSRTNKVVYYFASFLIEFVFAIVSFLVAKIRKVDFLGATGMKKKINGKIILWGFLISLVCLIGFSSLTNVFLDFLYLLGYSSTSSSINISNFGTYIIYVIVSCIAPAVFEELLFRGTICAGFKKYGEKVAIIASAFIFMLMHGSPDQTVHQFIIGLIVGYMFVKSGNLWLGVIVHFFNNFIAVTEAYFLQGLISSVEEEVVVETVTTTTTLSPILILAELISALLYAAIAYSLTKYLLRKILAESEKINKKEVLETNNDIQTSLVVDGEQTIAQMSISGEPTEINSNLNEDAQKEFEYDELFAEIQEKRKNSNENNKEKSSDATTIGSMIMLACSVGYLLIEWLLSLISGLS